MSENKSRFISSSSATRMVALAEPEFVMKPPRFRNRRMFAFSETEALLLAGRRESGVGFDQFCHRSEEVS